MATIQHLDTLPIDDDLLRVPTNPEEAAKCKCCLNLSFNVHNATTRLQELTELSFKRTQNSTTSSFYKYNNLLETYLNVLLTTSTIMNSERTELSPHYSNRKLVINSNKILPSDEYLESLTLTGAKTWGTYYGTLGYFINLQEEYKEYLTPSQLVDINVNHLIKMILNLQDVKSLYSETASTSAQLQLLFRGLDGHIKGSAVSDDISIYNMMSSVITDVEPINTAFRELRFYSVWLPSVLNWYIKTYETNNQAVELETHKEAFLLLSKVAEVCLSNGLDENSFTNLDYELIHQTISPIFYGVCEELNFLRKSASYTSSKNPNKSYIEQLADLFLSNIHILQPNGVVRQASVVILESYAPPGGYNLLAVMIATTLINRAYILTHETNLDNSTQEFNEFTDYELLGRISRLMYLAGACLKKTSLISLQRIGNNLDYLSNLEVTDFRSKDLIDGR